MTQQTRLHRHWHVPVRYDSLVYRVLRKPLIHSMNLPRVDKSVFVFGPCKVHGDAGDCYTLSLLGILHGLTGLTISYDKVAAAGPHSCLRKTGFNKTTGRYCCDTYAQWYVWDDRG